MRTCTCMLRVCMGMRSCCAQVKQPCTETHCPFSIPLFGTVPVLLPFYSFVWRCPFSKRTGPFLRLCLADGISSFDCVVKAVPDRLCVQALQMCSDQPEAASNSVSNSAHSATEDTTNGQRDGSAKMSNPKQAIRGETPNTSKPSELILSATSLLTDPERYSSLNRNPRTLIGNLGPESCCALQLDGWMARPRLVGWIVKEVKENAREAMDGERG
jgi:hypothetical protein